MPETPRKGSLFVLFLTVFIDLLGFGIVIPLLPLYGRYFSGTDEARAWVLGMLMASFSAMQFLFAPIWGRLSDRVGRRPVLMFGLLGSVVFYTLFGLATVWESLALLFVARIGAGICGATISTAQAYIADVTSLEDRPKGMALIGAAFGLGFTFGPLFGALAFPTGTETPTAMPGYLAAGLSVLALIVAYWRLPESLRPDSRTAAHAWIDLAALRQAVATPSIGWLLLASFVCVLAFGNFETTLSLLLRGEDAGPVADQAMGEPQGRPATAFHFSFREIFYTFSFIGLMLMIVQGGVVRRLAGRVSEAALAAIGAALELAGFAMMVEAIETASTTWLFLALAFVVGGFAFLTPSINSLLSRRSDPAWQGAILGLGQSVTALARILAPVVGMQLFHRGESLPFWVGGALMAAAGGLVLIAARRGTDYGAQATGEPREASSL
jgi:MFS family permease